MVTWQRISNICSRLGGILSQGLTQFTPVAIPQELSFVDVTDHLFRCCFDTNGDTDKSAIIALLSYWATILTTSDLLPSENNAYHCPSFTIFGANRLQQYLTILRKFISHASYNKLKSKNNQSIVLKSNDEVIFPLTSSSWSQIISFLNICLGNLYLSDNDNTRSIVKQGEIITVN